MLRLSHTKRIVLTALFTAIITVCTMVIQIPSPVSGYVNLGDVFVLFSAFTLGPIYGALAAGLGSALADVLTGYVIYAPGTLIIKAGMAVAAYFVFIGIKGVIKGRKYPSMLIAAIVAEVIMVAGYFLYACFLMGEGLSAAASIVGNLFQALIGIVVGPLLVEVLMRFLPKESKNKDGEKNINVDKD